MSPQDRALAILFLVLFWAVTITALLGFLR